MAESRKFTCGQNCILAHLKRIFDYNLRMSSAVLSPQSFGSKNRIQKAYGLVCKFITVLALFTLVHFASNVKII